MWRLLPRGSQLRMHMCLQLLPKHDCPPLFPLLGLRMPRPHGCASELGCVSNKVGHVLRHLIAVSIYQPQGLGPVRTIHTTVGWDAGGWGGNCGGVPASARCFPWGGVRTTFRHRSLWPPCTMLRMCGGSQGTMARLLCLCRQICRKSERGALRHEFGIC